jgi:WD40 repeat protein
MWLDRSRMEGGRSWWKQITEALDVVQFMIAVMTPGAVSSDNTAKEWRYARQQGVCVFPVKGVADAELDYNKLPKWMRKAHFYDLRYEWETFVNYLKSPYQAARTPFMAPDLPERFVERPAEFDRMLNHLLDDTRQNPRPGTAVLHGAGGFGKTTLGSALCHHEDVITAFDDGVLWVTLGQHPNVLEGLTKLYAALTGRRPGFVDVEDAALHLAGELEEKSCLVVIDDVWDVGHMRPFLRGGEGCTRLITTRICEIAAETEARVGVDEMTQPQAVHMLTGWTQPPPQNLLPFRQLARRLGEWPLLLELAGAALRQRIARGDTLQGALDYVNNALDRRGPQAFDQRNATERRQAVTMTVGVSLEMLGQDERERFVELAVFPRDTDAPLTATAALWGLSDFDTEDLIQRLDGLSLLKFNLPVGTIRLHDVMRAYLEDQLAAHDVPALHARLLDAWGDLRRLPDAYAWRRVGHHLISAGRAEELKRLLLDFEWLQNKLKNTGVTGLLDDYEIARESPSSSMGLAEALRHAREAVRLSAHILAHDKSQLPGQLLGRLLSCKESELQNLLRDAQRWRGAPWLRPLTASLIPPGGPLRRTLAGHTSWVLAVAVTKDWGRAVSASGDNTLKVWDLRSGAALLTLSGHSNWVKAVALTPDEQRAVSASFDNTLKVWDIEGGAELHTLRGHDNGVQDVAVTSDRRRAVSASSDHTLRVWDLTTGAEVLALRGHLAGVDAVFITPDDRRVISVSDDRTIKSWDLATGAELDTFRLFPDDSNCLTTLHPTSTYAVSLYGDALKLWRWRKSSDETPDLLTLSGHTARINAAAVTPDGGRAVSASEDGTLIIWDLESQTALHKLQGHGAGVRAVSLTPKGDRAVSASADHSLKVWDVASGAEVRTLRGHGGPVNAVAVTREGARVVSASDDCKLKVWDLESGAEVLTLDGHAASVRLLSVTPDGGCAVSASADGTLKVWDLDGGVERATLGGDCGAARALAVTPDGQRAVSAHADGTLKVWGLSEGKEFLTLRGHTGGVWGVGVAADGERLVSASDDNTVRVWKLATGKELLKHELRDGHLWTVVLMPDDVSALICAHDFDYSVEAIGEGGRGGSVGSHKWTNTTAVTADRRRALSATGHSTLTLWDLERGESLLTLRTETGPITAVAVTPNGKRALSASYGSILQLWDLETGAELLRFKAFENNQVRMVVLSSDGKHALFASYHRVLYSINLEDKTLKLLPGHSGFIESVLLPPDGKSALSYSQDYTLKLWNLETSGEMSTVTSGHEGAVRAIALTSQTTAPLKCGTSKRRPKSGRCCSTGRECTRRR